uniref:Retrovirus-related Pol polyprotein from type-1 retrotransposable element R1 2 n=1 Tax=Schizaphis graminum TaxID=13262 RepID=A0A2S2PSC1_SCHGA
MTGDRPSAQGKRHTGVPSSEFLMIRSWLSERKLLVGDRMTSMAVTCGVPQVSVLGPTLWNVAYDDLLGMDVPPGAHLVGFADDLAVVGVARTGPLLEQLVNPVLERIDNWMTSRGLQLAHQKTEAVMLPKKWAYAPPRLTIGGSDIAIKHLRYLGVILDTRLSYGKHIETVTSKASKSAVALSRLMPNTNAPWQWKRRLLSSVVESQLLYAAPVLANAVNCSIKARTNLRRPQRSTALRVIRAYRTVSDEAAFVLAGMPPADLVANERARIKVKMSEVLQQGERPHTKAKVKRIERKKTIQEWQSKWSRSTKASWTRRLIPDIVRWSERTTVRAPLTYHMTQALIGHGCFQHYLHRMGRADSQRCMHCPCTSDTAEHSLFRCPHWKAHRADLCVRLGRTPAVGDMADILCGPRFEDLPMDPEEKSNIRIDADEVFRLFYVMVESILTAKETEERLRQARGRR